MQRMQTQANSVGLETNPPQKLEERTKESRKMTREAITPENQTRLETVTHSVSTSSAREPQTLSLGLEIPGAPSETIAFKTAPLGGTPFVPSDRRTSSDAGLAASSHPGLHGATSSANGPQTMSVRKRNGALEAVDVNKIIAAVHRHTRDLNDVDPMRVATKAISGLYNGASTRELDQLCIQNSALLIAEEPEYSKLAARLLNSFIEDEVAVQGITWFSDSIKHGHKAGIIADHVAEFVRENAATLNCLVEDSRSDGFEYFGLKVVYDRYLLKSPQSRQVIETPQYFFLRVACGLARTIEEAAELYNLLSSLEYMASTPTLFNSGTRHSQMSSCYLLDSPLDDLRSIYQKYMDVAQLSKFAGGIGLSYSRIRARGSHIKGTNGFSNGIVPWLKTLDSSVAAVNQGGKRKGAACVYLETWHADIEEFLELRENTGDHASRTHNLNLANWVPDLFMKRVESDGMWSLFDPKEMPELVDLFGAAFEEVYVKAENDKRFVKQMKARDLYGRMMKTLAETGNGWITFKDASNLKSNQTGLPGNTIHLSNLCTEILEVTSNNETAVCNLGSINLSLYVKNGKFDFDRLARNVRIALKYLDRVVDINFYPIEQASSSNLKWRPVGLGVMGLQDVLFKLGLAFDSEPARELSTKIQEEVYFNALTASNELAERDGAHPNYDETRAAKGFLQPDLWGVQPTDSPRWNALRARIARFGLRNSLMIAIAPTATIASLVGCYESIEPQVSNLFKRETLTGEFLQVNRYLVDDLKRRGLWTETVRAKLKAAEGSIQDIEEIPLALKNIYRTAWELPMRSLIDMGADRGAYIDQSQSLNLFMESPNIGKLSSMYMYAWKRGLKTTYYLRSRPATKIKKTSHAGASQAQVPTPMNSGSANFSGSGAVAAGAPMIASTPAAEEAVKSYSAEEAVACSLENPGACEACQ